MTTVQPLPQPLNPATVQKRSWAQCNGDGRHIRDDGKLVKASRMPSPTRETVDSQEEPLHEKANSAIHNISLSPFYSESVVAKIWEVARRALDKSTPPTFYPEYAEPGGSAYVYRELDFWTSGFFPGSLYLLLERQRNHPHHFPAPAFSGLPQTPHPIQLQCACDWWTKNLHQNAHMKGTHDLSFMISPWARLTWELNGDRKAYQTLITAAQNLSTRFDPKIGCLRSWDTCVTKRYSFTDPKRDFLVIIDNMLNLDLLFWAATELRDPSLHSIARSHAEITRQHHIRPDHSTFHVVNFCQVTGQSKSKFTNQGFSDTSCWSRGQAWAITGFAQTYHWSKDDSFLKTAMDCADYFLAHLGESGVPYWDFDAEIEDGRETPTDTSAAMIAAYGMLLLDEALTALGESSPYLKAALHISRSVVEHNLNPPASFVTKPVVISSVEHGDSEEAGPLTVDLGEGGTETILNGATINNYEFAPRRWANHGLVYADYYFLLVGNKLLDMGVEI